LSHDIGTREKALFVAAANKAMFTAFAGGAHNLMVVA
jgi:hypothetical protein